MDSQGSELGRVVEAGEHPAVVPERVEKIGADDLTVRAGGRFRGPVLARNIRFQGSPFSVAGPTVALGSIEANVGADELCSLSGPVMARSSILVKAEGVRLPALRIVGDVTADRINASGLLVWGNVFGSNVKLSHCVVFGTIASAGDLSLEHVTSLSFRGRDVTLGERVQILQSTAIIDQRARFEGGPVNSLLYSAWFRDEAPDRYETEDIPLSLTSNDIKLRSLEDDEGNALKVGVLGPHDYLLNSEAVEKLMATNRELLSLMTVAIATDPGLQVRSPDLALARSFLSS